MGPKIWIHKVYMNGFSKIDHATLLHELRINIRKLNGMFSINFANTYQ